MVQPQNFFVEPGSFGEATLGNSAVSNFFPYQNEFKQAEENTLNCLWQVIQLQVGWDRNVKNIWVNIPQSYFWHVLLFYH